MTTTQTTTCQWFVLCSNPATALVAHPIIGAVPTCQRCIDKFSLEATTPAPTVTTLTADHVVIAEGARAYNYYDRKAGTVGPIEPDGWFDFRHDDGSRALLNGERISSLGYAIGKGWE